MNKPWSNSGSRAGVDYVDDFPAENDSGYGTEDHEIYGAEDYDAYTGPDNRWRWVAAFAAVVLLVAVVATMVITSGGDSVSTSTPLTPLNTPRTVIATAPPTSAKPPLPPETVVTVTPTPSATPEPTTPDTPAATTAPPVPAASVTYTVTGSRPLLDLVTIIYTDEQGLPRTDLNVALPWTKTLVLEPGVTFSSVTATSLTGKLNCAITNANGAVLVSQTNNSMIATCTE